MNASRRTDGRTASRDDRRAQVGSKSLLVIGFLAYLAALLVGYTAPAAEYELSIYASTPVLFWVGIGLSFVIAVLVAVLSSRGHALTGAIILGGFAMTTVVALPLVRGYYFYGSGDALTHLGWAKEFAAGTRGVTSIIYPAGHLSVASIARLTGFPVRRAMVLFVVLLAVVYFAFVPLVARLFDVGQRTTAFAAFSGFMLLPVTNIATHLQFHPYTLTVFLFPLVVYLLVRYISTAPYSDPLPGGFTAEAPVLGLVLVALIVFHPQTALNVLILFGTIAAVQMYHRKKMPDEVAENTRSVLGITLFFGLVFVLWVLPHGKFYALLFGLLESTTNAVTGEAEVGAQAKQRGGSLSDIGVTLTSLFFRMFLVQAVYIGLTAAVIATNLFGDVRETSPAASTVVSYLAVGGIALTPFFLLHFVGDVSGYFFRHIGFGMAIVTLVGSLGIGFLWRATRGRSARLVVRPLIATALVVMLVLSVLVAFPSPFIYKANQHVTESQMVGHERAFETAVEDVSFVGIRGGPDRFVDATPSMERASTDGGVPQAVVERRNISGYYESDRYLVVTQMGVEREVRSYDELRYSDEDLAGISGQKGVHRVRSNGDFELYYVEGETDGSAETETTEDASNAAHQSGEAETGREDAGKTERGNEDAEERREGDDGDEWDDEDDDRDDENDEHDEDDDRDGENDEHDEDDDRDDENDEHDEDDDRDGENDEHDDRDDENDEHDKDDDRDDENDEDDD